MPGVLTSPLANVLRVCDVIKQLRHSLFVHSQTCISAEQPTSHVPGSGLTLEMCRGVNLMPAFQGYMVCWQGEVSRCVCVALCRGGWAGSVQGLVPCRRGRYQLFFIRGEDVTDELKGSGIQERLDETGFVCSVSPSIPGHLVKGRFCLRSSWVGLETLHSQQAPSRDRRCWKRTTKMERGGKLGV